MVKGKENQIAEAVRVLRAGGVIVFPTDTAYGIGCDATNAAAVERIYRIKGRPWGKAFPMIVADSRMANKFFRLETKNRYLASRFWPGPLSLVLSSKGKIARGALERGTAAVRVPGSKLARDLARGLGRPIVATSANRSRTPTCYSIPAVIRNFSLRPGRLNTLFDMIVDAGALPHRKASTIVRVAKNGTVEVLRRGPIRL